MDITKIYLHTNPPKNEILRFFFNILSKQVADNSIS